MVNTQPIFARRHVWSVAVLALIAGLLLVHALDATFSHDEEQYVFGSLLAQGLSLYRDFVYLQTPYYPLLVAPLLSLFTDHYFLIARLVSWLLSVGSVLLIFALARCITGELRASVIIAVLFATSTVMLEAFGSARNDIMPCFFAVLGLYLLHRAHNGRASGRLFAYVMAGVALSAAASTKVLYGFYPAVAFIYVLVAREGAWGAHWRSAVLPFGLGLLLGAAPVLYYAITRWDLFWFQTFVYHRTAPIDWYFSNGLGRQLTVRYQVTSLFKYLFQDTTLAAGVLLGGLAAAAYSTGRGGAFARQLRDHGGSLYLALLAMGAVFCLLPRPAHVMYFPPLVPVLVLALASLYAAARQQEMERLAGPLLTGGGLVAVLPGVLALLLPLTQSPQHWLVNDVHQAGQRIYAALKARGLEHGKVATLSPIRVIDAGLAVYREFATGPFVFRSGDLWGEGRLRSLVATSPKTLDAFLSKDPPAAIYTGFEAGWRYDPDQPLEDYAQRHGYVRVEGDFGGGKLFVRGAASEPTNS